ncbi:thiolase domain-containing protein [Candidatus Woesearchaeota archaeon]|nr:thiolase domain-containing protein [Candidatus Woesearchaeota archaeon]
MYICGVGRTKFGKLELELPEIMTEAVTKALIDAKLRLKDIDAIFISNNLAGLNQGQLHLNSLLATILKIDIPIFRLESTCASGGATFYNSLFSLSKFKNILVLGVEKMTGLASDLLSTNIGTTSDLNLDQEQGFIFPVGAAMIIERYEKRFGNVMDDLALISLKNHENGNLNEYAHFYGKEVTLEKIKGSRTIVGKLRLYDCSPVSDGAVALVVSKQKRDRRSIKIQACEMATGPISLSLNPRTSMPAVKTACKRALSSAGMKILDMDLIEIHDGYTIIELITMEDLGLCKPGQAGKLIREGKTKLNGKIPINTDGGLKANGHPIGATGLAQIYEIVTQLRGEAGKRQVNAKTGLAHNIGGMVGSCVVSIFKRD